MERRTLQPLMASVADGQAVGLVKPLPSLTGSQWLEGAGLNFSLCNLVVCDKKSGGAYPKYE